MRTRFLFTAAFFLTPMAARAECNYLRTSYKEVSCKPLAGEKVPAADAVSSTTSLPGLEELPLGPMDDVTCTCTYVLRGSNPLCDTDREQEFHQTYPQDASMPVCPRAKSLCASVCPKQLP